MTAEPVIVPDMAAAVSASRRLTRQGWHRIDLHDLPSRPWDLGAQRSFCLYLAADAERAQHAMLAAVRGVRLIVIATETDMVGQAGFLDDLSRVAPPVQDDAGPAADRDGLLGLLADGMTVTSAAQAMHVSRRTANRWLSQALADYGVDSTAAAVRVWVSRQS
jgi:Homeodomain-like domain